MLDIGPSAGNKQPWRILKVRDQDVYHFYLNYSEDKKISAYSQFVRLDMGIAVCHFDLSAKELVIQGEWKIVDPHHITPKNLKYVISWIGSN